MIQQSSIGNHNGQGFDCFEHAAWLRDVLTKEAGRHYQVVQEPGTDVFFVMVGASMQDMPDQNNVLYLSNDVDVPDEIYRQALRSWVLSFPTILFGFFLLTQPALVIKQLLEVFRVSRIPTFISIDLLLLLTTLIGFTVALYTILRIMWSYYSQRLTITKDGVEQQTGIVSREIVMLRYGDIRSVAIRQGAFKRLLGLGTLELSSAGSDGVDVRFDNLANSVMLKNKIQNEIQN